VNKIKHQGKIYKLIEGNGDNEAITMEHWKNSFRKWKESALALSLGQLPTDIKEVFELLQIRK
jgi:hypothetical protein